MKAVSHLLVKASQRVISKFPIGEPIFAKQLALTIRIIQQRQFVSSISRKLEIMIASDFSMSDSHAASRHVLIVDDEVDGAYPLNRALSLKGLRVTHALDGNEGLAIIENDPPDLVLLDIMLPGRSGLLLLEAIRERTDFTAPIVMVSGIDADRHRDYALTLGAADYVTKPYAMSRMVRLVEQLLSPHQGSQDGASSS